MSEISSFLLDDAADSDYDLGGFDEIPEAKVDDKPPGGQQQNKSQAQDSDFSERDALLLVMKKKIDLLANQNASLSEAVKTKQSDKPLLVPATEEEWAANPNEAMIKTLRAESSKHEVESEKRKKAALEAQHAAAWQQVVKTVPDFDKDELLREAFAAEFYNESKGYTNNPQGPILAAATVVNELKWKFDKNQSKAGKEGEAPQEKSVPVPDARTASVKKAVMHSSGKNSSPSVRMEPEAMAVVKRLGIKPEQYMKFYNGGKAA